GAVALQNSYFEFRIDQEEAMQTAEDEYEKIAREYEQISGRYHALFEEYNSKNAEKILILTGSATGTAKVVVDKLREAEEKVGILKIGLFRPFPHKKIAEALKNAKEIIVLDRAQSIGTNPPFYSEIMNSLYEAKEIRNIKSYVYGLGGRDIFQKQIEDIFMGKIEGGYMK
ncbi:MAG: pyruvate ferredoxin oxidoreductase, partial [Candidatus Moraniibacteriota bacterium]